MLTSLLFAFGLLLASSEAKTFRTNEDPIGTSSPIDTARQSVLAVMKSVLGVGGPGDAVGNVGSLVMPMLLQQIGGAAGFKDLISDSLGLHEDFLKPVMKILEGMNKLGDVSPKSFGNSIKDGHEGDDEGESDHLASEWTNINHQFLDVVKSALEEELGELPSLLPTTAVGGFKDGGNEDMSPSGVWMLVKSTWQRVLSYMEEENALPSFMQLMPVRIIDRVVNLGDDLNLINFLAKKLDRDFAEFIAEEINPYLGPLKSFDSFYNFTRENGLSGVLDYFRSKNFGYTISAMSRFITAYFDDSFSDDLADQYIAFISFNNTDLYNFYSSLLRSHKSSGGEDAGPGGRVRREELQKATKEYKFNGYDFQPKAIQDDSVRDLARDGGYGGGGQSSGGGYGGSGGGGGYGGGGGGYGGGGGGYGGGGGGYGGGGGGYGGGGGGYGGGGHSQPSSGMMIDPSVVLSSVAIGALLGFLLFRLIRGTRRGRRDIGDGSLSLWLSDMPDKVLPWDSSVQRMKRHAQSFNVTGEEEFNLPDSLRGNVWSSDPVVGDDLLEEDLEEDDVADHLNHLWRVYKHSNETACVHYHLCDVMANSTAERLTGRDSSMALLMASMSNLMGVAGSGQLMDDVIQTMVLGAPYTCPTLSHCNL
ncbi:uncharacterized protein [Procambarus clarkii]|uniref:uncharacterized protein n=1 Tax=Procambarus clarkii TaxID=6728 RepID=UPI003742D3D3